MRINYSEEENWPGQFFLWQANCDRSLNGRAGQAALRTLETALLALPEPKLIAHVAAADGCVCAVGAMALEARVRAGEERETVLKDLEALDPDDEDALPALGATLKIPHLVGWKLVELNDIQYERETPEQRYEQVLAWVRAHIKQERSA